MESVALEREMASWPPSADTVRCPFAFMAEARKKAPVLAFAQPNAFGFPMYLVTGHAACIQVLSQHRVFTSNLADVMPGFTKSAVPFPFPEVPSFHEPAVLFFANGEDHRIKRRWSTELISPSRIRDWIPALTRLMDTFIDGFATKGACDFRAEFTDVFPVKAMAIILDLPPEAEQALRRVSQIIAKTDMDPNISPEDEQEKVEAMAGLFAVNRQMLEQRHANPGQDYISALAKVQSEADGALDVNALAIHLQGIQFGGDHAVGAYLAYVAAQLATHPNLQDQLRAEPDLIDGFVYETLRLEPPIPWLFRKCEADTVLEGTAIPRDAVVIVASVAGNRDPSLFTQPDTMLLDRPNPDRTLLSFGRGAHRCLGDPLARAMGRVMVERLLARFSAITLDREASTLDPLLSYQFRCPEKVILNLEARGRTGAVA